VQGLPSLQFGPAPPTQAPPEQVSPVVQALPSLQEAELFVWTQPLIELQESLVHPLASLQLVGPPLAQEPPEHVSPVVQALPSLQRAELLVWMHPLTALQESSVHPLASLQFGAAPPTHTPAEQVSLVVQALPSLQLAELFACTQPVSGLQESSVQPLASLQFGAAPPTHEPPEQASLVVQALPSLQPVPSPLFGFEQTPFAGLHVPAVWH